MPSGPRERHRLVDFCEHSVTYLNTLRIEILHITGKRDRISQNDNNKKKKWASLLSTISL